MRARAHSSRYTVNYSTYFRKRCSLGARQGRAGWRRIATGKEKAAAATLLAQWARKVHAATTATMALKAAAVARTDNHYAARAARAPLTDFNALSCLHRPLRALAVYSDGLWRQGNHPARASVRFCPLLRRYKK